MKFLTNEKYKDLLSEIKEAKENTEFWKNKYEMLQKSICGERCKGGYCSDCQNSYVDGCIGLKLIYGCKFDIICKDFEKRK